MHVRYGYGYGYGYRYGYKYEHEQYYKYLLSDNYSIPINGHGNGGFSILGDAYASHQGSVKR